MLVKPSVTEKDVFSQLEKYTGSFDMISSDQCVKVLSIPVAP
jgi:hypothetical protein